MVAFVATINTYNPYVFLLPGFLFFPHFFLPEDQEYIYSSTTPNINNKTSYRMLTLLCLFLASSLAFFSLLRRFPIDVGLSLFVFL